VRAELEFTYFDPGDLSKDLEVSPATVIDPNAAAIIAPAAALAAGRFAALFEQLHSASRVSRAVVPVIVIRRAGHHLALPSGVWSSGVRIAPPGENLIGLFFHAAAAAFDCEVGPATVVHPDHLTVRAPAVSFPAGRVATLLLQPYAPARIDGAVVPPAVVGRTRDGADAARSRASILVGINGKVGAAAAVHPDASAVKTPAIALVANRVAAFLQ